MYSLSYFVSPVQAVSRIWANHVLEQCFFSVGFAFLVDPALHISYIICCATHYHDVLPDLKPVFWRSDTKRVICAAPFFTILKQHRDRGVMSQSTGQTCIQNSHRLHVLFCAKVGDDIVVANGALGACFEFQFASLIVSLNIALDPISGIAGSKRVAAGVF